MSDDSIAQVIRHAWLFQLRAYPLGPFRGDYYTQYGQADPPESLSLALVRLMLTMLLWSLKWHRGHWHRPMTDAAYKWPARTAPPD